VTFTSLLEARLETIDAPAEEARAEKVLRKLSKS